MNLSRVLKILKGALTSELMLEWLGLYPITINDSILESRIMNNLCKAWSVTVRVYCPLKRGC